MSEMNRPIPLDAINAVSEMLDEMPHDDAADFLASIREITQEMDAEEMEASAVRDGDAS